MAVAEFIATFCTAVFAGAAIYVNLVEHPARMSCGIEAALTEWAPSYHHGARMQAPLALVAFVAAVAAWALGAGVWWLVAGLLIGAVIPFTLIIIKPVNDALHALQGKRESVDAQRLLTRWAKLHAVRSAVSLVALAIFIWQLVK